MSEIRQRRVKHITEDQLPPDVVTPSHSDTWAKLFCKLILWITIGTICILTYIYIRAPMKCVAWPDDVKVIPYEGVFELNTKLSSGIR